MENLGYKLMDMHTHCFPDAIAERAITSLKGQTDIPNYHDGTLDGLCAYEHSIHSSGMLVLPIATKPQQAEGINKWAASIQGTRDGLSVHAFGSVHPESRSLVYELDHLCSLGIRGVKLHPEYQDFFVDDEKYFAFYDELFKRGLIVCFHAGEDLGFSGPVHAAPERLAVVCDMFPEGIIIAAHMGGFRCWDGVRNVLAGKKNLYFDTSFSTGWLEPEKMVSLCRLHGIDRIFFGTDAPWTDAARSLEGIMSLPFERWELEGILYNNAAKLLSGQY